ncbi:tRNA-dihydrouridine synthase 3 [Thoreauomyces humboldtii]|nr:tRNA-dihydrouridine synthase 3 [Thoreauomyces humboldtii]
MPASEVQKVSLMAGQEVTGGQAPVKAEFLRPPTAKRPREDGDGDPTDPDGSRKRSRHEDRGGRGARGGRNGGRNKQGRGQNKNRPSASVQDDVRLCSEVGQGLADCVRGSDCKYSHDVKEYLVSKGEDLGVSCPTFALYGKCKFGYRCRYAGAHMDADGKLVVDEQKAASISESDVILNTVSKDVHKKVKAGLVPTPRSDYFAEWLEVARRCRSEIEQARQKVEAAERQTSALPVQLEEAAATSLASPPGDVKMEHLHGVKTEALEEQQDETAAVKAEPTEDRQEEAEVAAAEVGDIFAVKAEPTEEREEEAEVAAAERAKLGDISAVKAEPAEEQQEENEVAAAERAARQKILNRFDYDPATIRFRCSKKKTVNFKGKTYLAPLTTVGNLPFRRICKGFGVDITCGEMASTHNLFGGGPHEWSLMRRHASEDIFGVQIAGNNASAVTRICETFKALDFKLDFVDLNLGCPVDAVTKSGAGSALMEGRGKLWDMVSGATYVLDDIPFTVKIRQGIVTGKPIAHKLLPRFVEAGVSMVTLHGRSKEQRYTKLADWDYISELGQTLRDDPITFFGNGDIMSHEDYWKYLDNANVDGALIGRGALIKPWLFTEIKERRVWDISSSERFDMLKNFANHGLEYWGSDTLGVNTVRRFMCEWMSFTHRYIPVGLLEALPQRMNDRPPQYVGRDDLETLMASDKSEDWVKISEMLLGKAPEAFKFIPKHKSNSYEPEGGQYEG